jgi:hypothetical protein
VRHVRRHVDEVARAGLGGELERFAPAHPRPALDDVDHALELAVVMRAGLRVGVDVDRAGPELLRADRANVIAALRSMPGVCAVFGSSWSAGTTRTPSCFQATLASGPCVVRRSWALPRVH